MQIAKFNAGATILSEGDAGDTAFLIALRLGRGEHRQGRQGAEPRGPRGRRRVRRDEPDRARPAIRHGQGGDRHRMLRDQLRGVRLLGPDRSGTGRPADEDAGSPVAADERAHGQDRSRHQPPHPAVAARDPRRPRRAGRPVGNGNGNPAARAADAAADRALPDRAGRDRQGRAGSGVHAAAEHRGLPDAVVRQGRGDRPRHLEPVRGRRGAGVPRALRPLGAERRAPAAPGGAGDHARPVPPQYVPRDGADVRQRPALPRAGEARAAGRGRRTPAPDRAGLPLPGADPFRGDGRPAPLHGGVGPGDGGAGARRSAEPLPRDLPSARGGDPALRPVSAPQQDPAAGEHPGRGGLPAEQLVSLRPAADPATRRQPRLRRHRQEAQRQASGPRVPDLAAGPRRGGARRRSSSSTPGPTPCSPRRRTS